MRCCFPSNHLPRILHPSIWLVALHKLILIKIYIITFKSKLTSVMIFHHEKFLWESTSFIQIDISPNDMFCQWSSSLPDFYQSLHILPGDILVTSSWLPNDNYLLTWLHFMISSFLHIFIPRNFQFTIPCSYTTTSYST